MMSKSCTCTPTAPASFTPRQPVKNLDDLKGMKIVCHGLSAKVVGALGATPVAMPMPERYDALQKGVAEGVVDPIEALKGWKLGEVIKSTTENFGSAYSTGFFVVMNKDKWNSLPPDVQKVIETVNVEWIEKTGKALGRDRQGRQGVHLVQGQSDHRSFQGRGRKMGQAGPADPGRIRGQHEGQEPSGRRSRSSSVWRS